MKFQNREHEGNLLKLLVKDQSHPRDKERLALFYILAGNVDLYLKADYIYDFKEHLIKFECLNANFPRFIILNRFRQLQVIFCILFNLLKILRFTMISLVLSCFF